MELGGDSRLLISNPFTFQSLFPVAVLQGWSLGGKSEVVTYGRCYCYVGKYFLMNSHFLPLPEGVDNEQITFYSLWCGCEIGCLIELLMLPG